MIDKEKGPLYTENRKLFSKSTRKEVDANNINTADGWNLTRKLITANGTMPGPDIIVHQNPGHAFLHVSNNKSLASFNSNVSREMEVILNCPLIDYPNKPNWTCVYLSALK